MNAGLNIMCCTLDIPTTHTQMNTIENSKVISSLSPSLVPETGDKHVRFLDNVIVCTLPSPLDHFEFEEDWSAAWYRMEELEFFRNEARGICRNMRLLDNAEQASIGPCGQKTPSLARDYLTRGLEQRTCSERQRRKYLTTRFILKAAARLRGDDPVKLATVAQKCTAWATDLAIEEAARDYVRAHNDTTRVVTLESIKRPATQSECIPSRRVRARHTLVQA